MAGDDVTHYLLRSLAHQQLRSDHGLSDQVGSCTVQMGVQAEFSFILTVVTRTSDAKATHLPPLLGESDMELRAHSILTPTATKTKTYCLLCRDLLALSFGFL